METIKDIAERRGIYMFEHSGIVLVVANKHWFSETADVRYADREDTEDTEGREPNEVFFVECASIPPRMLPSYERRIWTLLDALAEQDPATYALLGGDHDGIIRRAL